MQPVPGKKLFSHPYYPRRGRGRGRRPEGAGGGHLLGGQALAEAQRLNRPRLQAQVYVAIAMMLDLILVAGTGLLAAVLALGLPAVDTGLVGALWVGALLLLVVVRVSGGYRIWRLRHLVPGLLPVLPGLVAGLAGVTGSLALAGRLQDGAAVWLGLWAGLALVALVGSRVVLWQRIRVQTRRGALEHRLVVVGGGPSLAPVLASLARSRAEGYRICGVFDERGDPRSPAVVAGFHKTGDLNELVGFVRVAQIDTVILAVPALSQPRLMQMMAILSALPVEVRSLPCAGLDATTPARRARRSRIGEVELIELFRPPITGFQALQKRAFDLVTASLALVMLSPVMLAVAVAVRLDSPGPILFRQRRHGFNNQPINILKFRSMHVDRCDPTAVQAVRRGDPRVTRVGRIIRRSSLDELPQLFNVLAGQLSMVGPRPHATAARTGDILYDEVTAAYSARHKVKPGITGWAQINGWRGELNTAEKINARISHDLHYIENWSLWMDLRILLATPRALLVTKNAY